MFFRKMSVAIQWCVDNSECDYFSFSVRFFAYFRKTTRRAAVLNSFHRACTPFRRKIIFAPLSPFDVMFFVEKRSSHPKKPLLEPTRGVSTPN